jgi:hypothetical protein
VIDVLFVFSLCDATSSLRCDFATNIEASFALHVFFGFQLSTAP